MWNLAFLLLFILQVYGKSSNLCRLNPPGCDGNKVIKVGVVRCLKGADPPTWAINSMLIEQTCDRLNTCDINLLMPAVESCCGDKNYQASKRPKLRFAYECVSGSAPPTTRAPTSPRLPTTRFPFPDQNAVTTKKMDTSMDIDAFCSAKLCQHQRPYCSAGTEIAVMKISNSLDADEVMNSVTYYCNKRQRCSEEYVPYVDNKCRSEDHMQLHYVCMKEKVTSTVTCDYEEMIDNEEGQIRSSDYPNMVPAGTSNCRIKLLFDTLSITELILLDLPEVEVLYKNEYAEWSPTIKVSDRHSFISAASEVLLSVDFDKLPQRRIWLYYRVIPADLKVDTELPWTSTCQDSMGLTTPRTPDTPKVTANPSKDMHMVHTTKAANQGGVVGGEGAEELSTAPHIVIPDGIPVDTDLDKMEPSTVAAMIPTVASSSSISPNSNSGSDVVSPVAKPPHTNREKVSSSNDTPTTGLYSRDVVIGLIAGVVILGCMVIILLTALVASMRRNPSDPNACGATTKLPHPPPPPSQAGQL